MFLVKYKSCTGKESKEFFEIEYLAKEFVRELQKQKLITCVELEKLN